MHIAKVEHNKRCKRLKYLRVLCAIDTLVTRNKCVIIPYIPTGVTGFNLLSCGSQKRSKIYAEMR